MFKDDMIQNIEYLREKADVSYEEAADLLDKNDGNVMRVLVELEKQGRVYEQPHEGAAAKPRQSAQQSNRYAKEKTESFLSRAMQNRLVVSKRDDGGTEKTVVNVSVPFAVGAAVVAPYLAVASAALTFISGYRVKVRKEKTHVNVPDSAEEFVDQTVSNIKETASSFEHIDEEE